MSSRSARVACVDLPALPLQLALRTHPEWKGDPVVVVEDDRPLAAILWANRFARAQRIHAGMKFSQAQSLAARLHAAVISPKEIDRELTELFIRLLSFSPHVEPSQEWPGLFWIDPQGLEPLYPSLESWATRIHDDLASRRFHATVVVGTQRGRVLAIARMRTGPHVFLDAECERREADRAPLDRLSLSPQLAREMRTLGVDTLGEFLELPRIGLEIRYGPEAATLHDLATGHTWTPLRPRPLVEPLQGELEVDPPDDQHTRLLFGIKNVLHGILDRLRARDEGVAAILVTLSLDHAPSHCERMETAAPTLDVVRLVDLIRLRLSTVALPAPVEHIAVEVEAVPAPSRQPSLLARPVRDQRAAAAALARVKAALGEGSVTCARLEDAWLPEESYRWVELTELPSPCASAESESSPLIRNVLAQPLPLPDIPRHETERWLGRFGAVQTMSGPSRIRHRWWRERIERDYYFLETKTGDVLWVFFDRTRRGWFLHGIVD